jgi:3-oxoacyl-[acyl-carrier-protein] synthase-1
MQEHPFMIDKRGSPMVVAIDAKLPVEINGAERLLELALSPAYEALKPITDRNLAVEPIHVLIALPERRPGMPENLEKIFSQQFGSRLSGRIDIQKLSCHALGHAGGLICMEHAMALIANGRSKLCLVGGVDSYLTEETLEWLDSLDQLHSESTIWGFCPSEGAGFCLLASQDLRDRLELSASTRLLSAASTMEANRIKTDTVCIGEGLSEAIRKTLERLLSDGVQIEHTICDMNGEPYRGNEYGFAMLRSSGWFSDESDFQTPADCWGDVGAASGPLFAVLTAFAAEKGYALGPLTFVWASSEKGQRACALLQATADIRRF